MAQSPTFASRLKRKLLSGPILGGAYTCNWFVRRFEARPKKERRVEILKRELLKSFFSW
jgi:hypothetical protein